MTGPPVTLVTGARKGIGRCLAEHYAGLGHRVVGCSRGESDFEHPNYVHIQADVASEEDALRLFGEVRKRLGGLDNLLNNAGVASMNHVLLTPMTAVRRILETNVTGTFLFSREAAKLMRRRKAGRIVNFGTVATPLHLEGEAVYAASKAAVVELTRILARELAEFGVTVNAVGPTPVRTDLTRGVPEDRIEALIARQAIKRWGEFEDVINVVDFFLRPESSFVTGQTLYLGGVSA